MKLPFSFNLALVFRLLFPGFILAVGFSPLLQAILNLVGAAQWFEVAFAALTIFLGWLFVISDMPIYMAFEGRRYWPPHIWRFFKKREMNRLDTLRHSRLKAMKRDDRASELEASVELRKFPMNSDGDFYALYPTRLGNLLASYEEYPDRIYGMDSSFYWPRLWLTLENHRQADIDQQQALTDSTLYSVAALYICGVLSIIYMLLQVFNLEWMLYLPAPATLGSLAIICFVLGYLVYRVSLHLFAQFGETFKSVFDIYHKNVFFPDVVNVVADLTGDSSLQNAPQKLKYRVSWRYLHNYRVKLHEGGESYTPEQLRKIVEREEAAKYEDKPGISMTLEETEEHDLKA